MSVDDRLAILETIAKYSYAWDGLDAEAYVALFTEDGVFEVDPHIEGGPTTRLEGHAEIRAWATGRFADKTRARTRHNQGATVFDALTADTARTRTMNMTTRLRPGEHSPRVASTGVYTDDWRKTADGWRFARRTLQHDVAGTDEAAS